MLQHIQCPDVWARLQRRVINEASSIWNSSVGRKAVYIAFSVFFIVLYLSSSYRPDAGSEPVVVSPIAPLQRAPSVVPSNRHIRFTYATGWNTFAQFNNQLLTIYYAAETALSLGRRLVPQALETHGDEDFSFRQVPFSEIFDVSDPTLRRYFDLEDPLISRGDDDGASTRNDTRFLSYVTVAASEYFHSDRVNVSVDPDRLMWYYHKMRNTWCFWYKCIEPLPIVNALRLHPRLMSVVTNFTNFAGGAVARSIGVHLRAGDQEIFCRARKDYRHYLYYSCYQNTAEELIANIELYRKNGEKIFLATNAARDSAPVRGLYDYHGEENVIQLPHLGEKEKFRGILGGWILGQTKIPTGN
eukprot:TRINITY_DN5402_c0_g1_i1.p1 TRINITY_DN5402_c0_g1~~TRINITY_DN5402_c0_g1_i1.p1  ORF type:complete len:358 (+),score=18.64 TRINITY_DN5402_c0_g1_i1:113-1186(+)